MAIVAEGGRHAVTKFRALERFGEAATAFEAELLTGRTHQVRVHFATHGFPLAGDSVYAEATPRARAAREAGLKRLRRDCPSAIPALLALDEAQRQFLHAAHLAFTHPVSGERLAFTRELPSELEALMVDLRACH
jgi:23S rRNA pseudouridine1911/1915/1917 synthase